MAFFITLTVLLLFTDNTNSFVDLNTCVQVIYVYHEKFIFLSKF
jgi:hypothetical protein